MRITLDFVNPDNINRLVTESVKLGFVRENPRKAWTDKDKREACRFVIDHLVRGTLILRKEIPL